jgi:hypothetical protein
VEVLLLGLIAWGWLVAIQLLHLRDWQSLEANLRWNFVGRVVLKQVAICHSGSGVAALGWGIEGLYWLVGGMVFSILAALFGGWVLLVEIKR